jgi:hypothetical protein
MADIATALASTVIFLFSPSQTGVIPIGTAFIVGYPIPGDANSMIPFVITAKHVVGDLPSVIGRFNPESGDKPISVLYEIEKLKKSGDFFEHPDSGVDIVLFRTPHFKLTTYQPLPLDLVADKDTFKTEDIKPTDRVVFPSLLVNFLGTSRNYPVTRDGSIALIPDEEVPMEYQIGQKTIKTRQNLIFVDARSIPGASGSPVFLWPGPRLRHNSFAIGGGKPLLLGVMHGFYPALPRELVSIETTEVKQGFMENSGVAIVFPAWRIREIIQSESFQKRINELVKELPPKPAETAK